MQSILSLVQSVVLSPGYLHSSESTSHWHVRELSAIALAVILKSVTSVGFMYAHPCPTVMTGVQERLTHSPTLAFDQSGSVYTCGRLLDAYYIMWARSLGKYCHSLWEVVGKGS